MSEHSGARARGEPLEVGEGKALHGSWRTMVNAKSPRVGSTI
jgi:hypothetical protein